MDLKDFIKLSIGSVVDATKELQEEYAQSGAVINAPSTLSTPDFYTENALKTHRRIQLVEFDVAVTVGSSTAGGGGGQLKIFSVVNLDANGSHSQNSEQVSRVKFSIPIVFPGGGSDG